MKRILRILATLGLLLAIGVGLSLWGVYRAARHVRPFYLEAVAAEPTVLEEASLELEAQATALYSDTQSPGRWSAVFTSQQLNGWLATQLDGEHSKLLPAEIQNPRLAIAPNQILLGFLANKAGVETVVSVDAEVFLSQAGTMAIRLKAVQAGTLPLPTARIAEEIRAASEAWSFPIRWTRLDGDIVALIDLGEVLTDDAPVAIDMLELREGEIFIAGETEELPEEAAAEVATVGPEEGVEPEPVR